MCIYRIISFCFISVFFVTEGDESRARTSVTHKILLDKLLSEYGSKYARPVAEYNKSVDVYFYMFTNQVVDLNEHDQLLTISAMAEVEWKDEFLAWNTTEYPGVTALYIPITEIWRPDLYIVQKVHSGEFDDGTPRITPDGTVLWAHQMFITTSCKIDPRFFPFDTQTCHLTFASWIYDSSKLDLHIRRNRPPHMFFADNGIWNLSSIIIERFSNHTVVGYPGQYPEIRVSLQLTRRSLFYVLVIIVPCTLLSLINLMVFMLPTESGEKVSLGITNFLALVLVQQLVGEFIPPASDIFPEIPILISYYFTPVIITGCLSVVSGVITANLKHKDASHDIPSWLYKFTRLMTSRKYRRQFEDRESPKMNGNHNETGTMKILLDKEGNEEDGRTDKLQVNGTSTGDDNNDKKDDINNIVDGGWVITWSDVACVVNKLLFISCLIITGVSMIITVSLFAYSS